MGMKRLDSLPEGSETMQWTYVSSQPSETCDELSKCRILVLRSATTGDQYRIKVESLEEKNIAILGDVAASERVTVRKETSQSGEHYFTVGFKEAQAVEGLSEPTFWNTTSITIIGVVLFAIAILFALGIMLWLLPIYIAHKRQHSNFVPILIVDLLVGWTFIGAVVCLAWAFSDNVKTVRVQPVTS